MVSSTLREPWPGQSQVNWWRPGFRVSVSGVKPAWRPSMLTRHLPGSLVISTAIRSIGSIDGEMAASGSAGGGPMLSSSRRSGFLGRRLGSRRRCGGRGLGAPGRGARLPVLRGEEDENAAHQERQQREAAQGPGPHAAERPGRALKGSRRGRRRDGSRDGSRRLRQGGREGPRHVGAGGIAVLGLLGEGPHQHPVHGGRQRGIGRGGARGIGLHHLVEHRVGVGALEGEPSSEHLVEHDAEGEEVGPVVDLLALDLLGRHVVGRAEELPLLGEVRAVEPGDAEVGDLHLVVGGDQDVRRLDVAVDHPVGVGVVEARRDLRRQEAIRPPRAAAPPSGACPGWCPARTPWRCSRRPRSRRRRRR